MYYVKVVETPQFAQMHSDGYIICTVTSNKKII